MATTSTAYATGATGSQSAGSWTNTANATGATDSTVAVWASTTSGSTGTLELTGYNGQTMIGAQPTSVDSVSVDVVQWLSAQTARMTSATAQLFSGATAIGSTVTLTLSQTAGNTNTFTFGTAPTWAQCTDLRVRIVYTKSGTQACNGQVDAVGLRVNYTPAPQTLSGDAALTGTAAIDTVGGFPQSTGATVTGTAAVSAGGDREAVTGAALAATATLSASGAVDSGGATVTGAAALSVSATITADAEIVSPRSAPVQVTTPAGGGAVTGAATLTATATISAGAAVTRPAGASLTGSASITAAGALTLTTGAALTGTAAVSTAGFVARPSGATVTATATVSTTAVLTATAAASLTGTATIAATGSVPSTWGPPSGLTVTPISGTRIDLSWTSIAGASGYDIERDGVVIAMDVVGTTYSDTGLTPSSTHSYRARSVRA